ncbi:hypothetical protein B0H16DRAFT_1844712 [Mycena metata]|uniref:F-box domain-containing protein n=1 Tax=Mycena metata TaxID=1033252 RepID=A0AAD7N7S4_9AGAR|nr:hypothetical protein B0H16DRAFT_1844712 [Mycena metata]
MQNSSQNLSSPPSAAATPESTDFDVPLPAKSQCCKAFISTQTTEIHCTEIELPAAEYSRSEAYTAILSPVRRIPAELLCEIFMWTLPHTRRLRGETFEVAPWRLGHIYQRWRAITVHYAPLWTRITLCGPMSWQLDAACPPSMVETQLCRSGNALLDVYIDTSSNYEVESESLALVINQSSRWQSLCVRASPSGFSERIQAARNKLPVLHTLDVLDLRSRMWSMFLTAPHLRQFLLAGDEWNPTLWTPGSRILVHLLKLPWSQITRFRGASHPQYVGLAVLNLTPNLVECGMAITPRWMMHLGNPHVVLPQLQRFRLSSAPPSFLQHVTAPALKELWISQEATTSLLDFIHRSACSLTTLAIYDCSAPDLLIPILAASPNLTTFCAVFRRTTERDAQLALLNALRPLSNGQPDACPILSRLVVGDLNACAINPLLDIAVLWHTPPITFLRAFYIGKLTSGAMDALPRVAAMKAEGFDVAIDAEFIPSVDNYIGLGRP